MAMAEASLSSVFQGTANEETAKKWFGRLVWAQLPVGDAKLWWPSLRFESIVEFDNEHQVDAAGNFDYRIDLTICVMEKINPEDGPVQFVRFLGRPLEDLQPVLQNEVLEFVGHLSTRPGVFSPEHFVAQLGFDKARPFYEDFHRGMDDFAKIISQLRTRPLNFEPWATKAQRVWAQFLATQPQQQMVLHQDPPAAPAHAQFPPQQPSLRQVLSPNNSVAAVSVADDSVVSVNAHHRVKPSHSTTTTKLSSGTLSDQRSHEMPQQLDFDKFPQMDPLGMITWKEARVQITCAGWTKVKNSDMEQYQPYPKGPQMGLEQTKNICQQLYQWKPLSEDATHTPLPPRVPTRHQEPPESNAKNYSFGFLWKHKCLPDGWKRIKPPREAAALVDYYYLRPGFTLHNLGVKNEDYFDDHYGVLDWCQRNNYYPTSDWNTGDESSVATEVAYDPSAYLDQLEPRKGPSAKANKKTKKKSGTPRNYSFGVLWASHLEPRGWTMPKAKRNALTDYYYVRPGCTVEGGTLNIDYFATTEDVLEYCAKHHDYPESSGASTCTPDDRTIGTATLANEETSDDESTKIPAETEDEATKPIIEDDDHTTGEFSTPGTKTQPQDPGKPLLRDDDDETPELDEEETYYWKNLWPVLRKRGWETVKAKNKFDDWWYVLPRRLELDERKDHKMVKGKDYFTTQEEVIDYCKRVDQEDTRIADKLKATKDDESREETSAHSHQTIQKTVSKDTKTSQRKKNQPKPKQNPKIKRKRVQEPMTVKDIQVFVDVDKNEEAPWVHSALPKNLHNIVTTVGGFNYIGIYYYLHNESPKQFTHRFQDIPDLLKYLCSLGRGNYHLNPEAETENINQYNRLIDYAFVPGLAYDHRRIRPLTRDEIILCLKEIFHFTFNDGEWQVPEFLRTKPEAEVQETPSQLKLSYHSLTELLQALRGIEHLERDSGERRRKPLDKKALMEQREKLIMAFRLSIAEDAVVNGLDNNGKSAANEVKSQEKKKVIKTPKHCAKVNRGDTMDSNVTASSTKKRGSPGSASKEGSKKLKPDGELEIQDLKVKWKDKSQINPAPWLSAPCRDFSSAKLMGVSHQGGYYYLPGESSTNFNARFTSIDEVFTHLCTYGNYSLAHVDKDAKVNLKMHIALGNVRGLPSTWNIYRLLDSVEAIAILGVLGFKEQPDKSWLVPDILLKEKNPFRKGKPALIKAKYPSLEELRVALRSLPNLEMTDGSRRRRVDSKLNEHQMIAFRLWLASGPEGPDDTTGNDTTDDESRRFASNDEGRGTQTIEEGITPENLQDDDKMNSNNSIGNDEPENGDACSQEATLQQAEQIEMAALDNKDEPAGESYFTVVAPVMESEGVPSILDSNVPCASDSSINHNRLIDSLDIVHDHTLITQPEPHEASHDLEMADSETEPTNEPISLLRTFANSFKLDHAIANGGLESACSVNGDTEMTDVDFGLWDSKNENVCPNIHDVCMGNTSRELLTQPKGNSSMSQESDDAEDEVETFIDYGRSQAIPSPISPAETKATEDIRKVYSVEQEGACDRKQGTWLTQEPHD